MPARRCMALGEGALEAEVHACLCAEARASDITNEHRNQAELSPAWHFCRICCMSDTVASACWTTAKSFMACSEIQPSRSSDDVEKHTFLDLAWVRGASQPQDEPTESPESPIRGGAGHGAPFERFDWMLNRQAQKIYNKI